MLGFLEIPVGTFHEPLDVERPQGNLYPHFFFYDNAGIHVLEVQTDTRAEVELQMPKQYMEIFTCPINI